jgi:large repetitive protein
MGSDEEVNMRALELRPAILPLALLLLSCPGSSNPTTDQKPFNPIDSGSREKATADKVPSKPRTSCKSVGATTVYTDTTDHAGWMPRVAWSNDQFGVVWRQETTQSSTVVSHAAFARLDKDGKLKGSATMLTQSPTANTGAAGPQVAVSGLKDGFLVVWSDTRAGSSASDLYLLQLSGGGMPLDKGNPCSTAGCGQVKITGSGKASTPYLVRPSYVDIDRTDPKTFLGLAWRDSRNYVPPPCSSCPSSGRNDIFFKVVSFDGTDKVAEQRITTDKSKTNPNWPVMAYDGTNYAVVWEDTTNISSVELFFAFVSGEGKVMVGEQSLTVNQGLFSSPPDLVWAGSDYGISFSTNPAAKTGQVKLGRITSAGALLAQQKVNDAGNPCTPAISYNGEHYAVVWQDNCGEAGSKLVFALVGDSGAPLQADGTSCTASSDPTCGIVTVPPDATGTAAFPNMISVNGDFAVTWMNAPNRRIHFAKVACTAP